MNLSFFVHGDPVPQGSMRAFLHKHTKRVIVTHNKPKDLRSWRNAIAEAAARAAGGQVVYGEGPVMLELVFHLPPPKSRPKALTTPKQLKEWAWPIRRPDIDKLFRAVMDALVNCVIRDDSQIVDLRARKEYALPAGVHITLSSVENLSIQSARTLQESTA